MLPKDYVEHMRLVSENKPTKELEESMICHTAPYPKWDYEFIVKFKCVEYMCKCNATPGERPTRDYPGSAPEIEYELYTWDSQGELQEMDWDEYFFKYQDELYDLICEKLAEEYGDRG